MSTIFTRWVRPNQTRDITPTKITIPPPAEDTNKTVVLQWGGGADVKVFQNQFSASVSLYMQKQQREQRQNLNQ